MPKLCFGCNNQLYRGENLLCTVCRNDLPITDNNFSEENRVDRIFYGRIPIKKAGAFLFYSQNGIVKQLLHHLKYKNQEQVGEFIGNWFGEILKEQGGLEHIDAIIPVPLHPARLRKRGYNQVDKFGEQLANHLGTIFLKNILIKTVNTKTLTKKNRLNRWMSAKELYEVTDYDLLKNKKVLLVDDVITTGATIEACGSALLKIEGIELYLATMAVVP